MVEIDAFILMSYSMSYSMTALKFRICHSFDTLSLENVLHKQLMLTKMYTNIYNTLYSKLSLTSITILRKDTVNKAKTNGVARR